MPFLYALLLCMLSTCVLGQSYVDRPGILIDRTNTSRTGTVRYYDWNTNPQTIEFTNTGSQVSQTIRIRDIHQLNVVDEAIYEGLYLHVPRYAKGPIKFNNELIQAIDSTYYLAELLIESEPVKLYRFFDFDNKDRFVLWKNDSLVLLNDIHTRLEKGGFFFDYAIPEYQTTLKSVLNECPTLKTTTTAYSENSLTLLIKEYLSFCHIDSKIYLEKTKFGKVRIGVGAFGSFWRTGDGQVSLYGASLQLLLPKLFHNKFLQIDLGNGVASGSVEVSKLQFGLYGGQYFGRKSVQAKVYTGLSTILGPFDTGLGISYRKMISAEFRYPVFAGLFGRLREDDDAYIRPLINLRAIVPLGKRE